MPRINIGTFLKHLLYYINKHSPFKLEI